MILNDEKLQVSKIASNTAKNRKKTTYMETGEHQ